MQFPAEAYKEETGKSTQANEVEKVLHERGYITLILDGDNLRHRWNRNLGFSHRPPPPFRGRSGGGLNEKI